VAGVNFREMAPTSHITFLLNFSGVLCHREALGN